MTQHVYRISTIGEPDTELFVTAEIGGATPSDYIAGKIKANEPFAIPHAGEMIVIPMTAVNKVRF